MPHIHELDDSTPWGTYALRGADKLLFAGLPAIGLSRGIIRKTLRKKWFSRSEQTPIDIEVRGVKYRFYPYDNRPERNILFNSNRYDDAELSVFEQYISRGKVFFDIGANVGYYSLFAAKRGARCYAFEPIPQIRRRQAFNVKINGLDDSVVPMPFALGDKEEKAQMWVTPDQLHSNTLTLEEAHRGEEAMKVDVEVKTLAAVVADLDIADIDALKIDAEGMEDRVLLPYFQQTDKAMWPICVVMEHRAESHWKTNIIDWMQENGYRVVKRLEGNTALARD